MDDATLEAGAEAILSDISHDFDRDLFGKCPYGPKNEGFTSISPVRVSADEVIIEQRSIPGALPAFVYGELTHGPLIMPRCYPGLEL